MLLTLGEASLFACTRKLVDSEPTARERSEGPVDADRDVRDSAPPLLDDADVAAQVGTLPREWHRVLHIGDSTVGFRHGLTRALEHRFQDAGVRFYSSSVTNAGIRSFDSDERMAKLILRFKPDVVIINLGTNNVANPRPDALAGNIRSIVDKVRPRDCYWIGPPLPIAAIKKDTGVINAIAESAPPCKFFDSSPLSIERQTDRVHPTDRGGEAWAEAFWLFLLSGAMPEQVDSGSRRAAHP